jgi:Tfp pilus assembly protein PilW
MKHGKTRAGFSLLEMVLFLAILSIMLTTVIAVFISTQETRVRQQGLAEIEQRGTQILETLTKTVRRAETVLAPSQGSTGSTIALQMSANGEFPTIFSETSSGNILLVQKTAIASLLNSQVNVRNLQFKNLDNTTVVISFDLISALSLIQLTQISRHFESTVTLFPDDISTAGGCHSCPLPVCTLHQYIWNICSNGVCAPSDTQIAC